MINLDQNQLSGDRARQAYGTLHGDFVAAFAPNTGSEGYV